MQIKNCVIITQENSYIEIPVEEQPFFTGNRVFSRSVLPSDFLETLRLLVDSGDIDAATPDFCGTAVKPELVG